MSSPLIKICGLTNLEDTLAAIDLGADLLGFNFYPDSPRYLSWEKALKIFDEIPTNIPKVGVFVNANLQGVIDYTCELGLDYIQFHGDETPEFCNEVGHPWFKAFRLSGPEVLQQIRSYECDWVLIDAYQKNSYGGTGAKADWSLARQVKETCRQVILAGGLDPDNVQVAIASVQPFGVDVASGVEKKPGIKDHRKMELFIQRAKSVAVRLVPDGDL